jgi:CRP-like cAMP-binding protein
MTPNDWQMIRKSALFNRLTDEAVREFITSNAIVDVERGAMICVQGAPAEHYHIVLQGLVKLCRHSAHGQSAVISIHGPAQAFMEAETLSSGIYSATAEAVSAVRLVKIDASNLRQRIGRDAELALSMLGSTSIHLKVLLEHVEKLKILTGPARLADFIVSLAGPQTGSAEVVLPYEKQLIAGQLGMTPESFSRALSQLRRHGVQVNRDRLEVKNIDGLREFIARSM